MSHYVNVPLCIRDAYVPLCICGEFRTYAIRYMWCIRYTCHFIYYVHYVRAIIYIRFIMYMCGGALCICALCV